MGKVLVLELMDNKKVKFVNLNFDIIGEPTESLVNQLLLNLNDAIFHNHKIKPPANLINAYIFTKEDFDSMPDILPTQSVKEYIPWSLLKAFLMKYLNSDIAHSLQRVKEGLI